MKKIIYFIAMALLCSMTITLQAQEANDKAAEKAAKKAEKEAKKAEKEAKKAAEKAAKRPSSNRPCWLSITRISCSRPIASKVSEASLFT